MSLFIDKNKRRKSPLVMLCFAMAFVFMAIHGFVYGALIEPLYIYVSLGSEALTTVVHGSILSFLGCGLCCLFFFLPDKRIVPGAYTFLAVFLLISLGTAAMADGADILMSAILLFGLGPVIMGNAMAWGMYALLKHLGMATVIQPKTIVQEINELKRQSKANQPPDATPEPEILYPAEHQHTSFQDEAASFYEDLD